MEFFDVNRYDDDFDVVVCEVDLGGDPDLGIDETDEDCVFDDDLDSDFDFGLVETDENCVCDEDFEE